MNEKKLPSPARGGTTVYDRKSKPCETGIVKQGITAKNNPPIRRDRCGKKGNKEMKKLMFALATAAALVGIADIESANTVGYVNRTAVKGGVWQIMPCQFETTQSTAIDLQSYVQGSFTKTVSFYDEGWDTGLAPEIQIRDPKTGKTTHYYFLSDAYVEENDSELAGWADIGGNFVKSINLEPGSAFWFYCPENCDVTFAGQVIGESTAELKVYSIWTLIGNAFPQGFALNSIPWTGIDAGVSFYDEGWDTGLAPEIQVRDPQTGKTTHYYFLKDAYIEESDSELVGWADIGGNYVPTTEVIPAGVGFWFHPTAEMNVQFGL